jgi:hypothetical protein
MYTSVLFMKHSFHFYYDVGADEPPAKGWERFGKGASVCQQFGEKAWNDAHARHSRED